MLPDAETHDSEYSTHHNPQCGEKVEVRIAMQRITNTISTSVKNRQE
jgi:NifU-like protein involved in Fe-S cluster formation